MVTTSIDVILAQPRGFCAGAERAIAIVERAIETYGPPIYVRHEIVHNKHVLKDLKSKGAIFVKEIDEIPEGAITIFSAHGVSKKVVTSANEKSLETIDATCPLVTKVHNEGQRYAKKGFEIILIGHEGHPEVEGTKGRIDGTVHLVSTIEDVKALTPQSPDKLSFITQTTLSVDDTKDIVQALKEKFPKISGPNLNDICYATQNRQQAVKELAEQVDLILVLGSKNSSNSNRLKEIGLEKNIPSYLIDDCSQFDPKWLENVSKIGITAGASAPEILVQNLMLTLKRYKNITIKKLETIEENVHFKLPLALRKKDDEKSAA